MGGGVHHHDFFLKYYHPVSLNDTYHLKVTVTGYAERPSHFQSSVLLHELATNFMVEVPQNAIGSIGCLVIIISFTLQEIIWQWVFQHRIRKLIR